MTETNKLDTQKKLAEEILDVSSQFEDKILEISASYLKNDVSAEEAMKKINTEVASMGIKKIVLFEKLKEVENNG